MAMLRNTSKSQTKFNIDQALKVELETFSQIIDI